MDSVFSFRITMVIKYRVVGFDWIGFGNSSRPKYENGPTFIEPLRQFWTKIQLIQRGVHFDWAQPEDI